MPIYIDIPPEYEDLLRELADDDDRPYRHEAAHLLKWAITERIRTREADRERHLEEAVYGQAD
jgi:hypothetical protein